MKSDAVNKKHWSADASELFNLYVEVGEVKLSSVKKDDCRYVECWISSFFHKNCIREECRNTKRRPIYGVIEHIEDLCGGENACVMIMEDDNEDAVSSWSDAVYLLIKYIKRIDNVKAVIIFTKRTREELRARQENSPARVFERMDYPNLCDAADVCVTRQSSVFSCSKDRKIFINKPSCSEYVKCFPKEN